MRREMSRGQRARGGIGLVADGPDGTGRGYSKRYGYRRWWGGGAVGRAGVFLSLLLLLLILFFYPSYTKNEFSLDHSELSLGKRLDPSASLHLPV